MEAQPTFMVVNDDIVRLEIGPVDPVMVKEIFRAVEEGGQVW